MALAAYAAATWLGMSFETFSPSSRGDTSRDLIYLPTPGQARLMALGFTNVLADYYWVKALQYFMDPSQVVNRYKNLADFLDLVVGIDPDYEYAYKFAGLSVPYDSGRFHFVNTNRSTSFLERGVARFPQNWQLHFFLGYNYLNYSNDPTRAAEQFAAAAKLEGAPTYLRAFASRLFAVGGEIDRAIAFATHELANAPTPEIEALMRSRLIDLQVEKELRRIEAAARSFHEQRGRWPVGIEELAANGLGSVQPGYSLDAEGVAHSTIRAERMVVYEEKAAPPVRGE